MFRPVVKALWTHRLRLRPWREGDAPALAAMNADPEVMRYVGSGPKPYHVALAQARETIAENRDDGLGLWAIEARASGSFHGWVGLFPLDGGDEIELGYRLPRASWGRGIATEAGRRLVAYGFADLGLERIAAITDTRNFASRRVLEKLGFGRKGLRTAYGVEGCLYYLLTPAADRDAPGA